MRFDPFIDFVFRLFVDEKGNLMTVTFVRTFSSDQTKTQAINLGDSIIIGISGESKLFKEDFFKVKYSKQRVEEFKIDPRVWIEEQKFEL